MRTPITPVWVAPRASVLAHRVACVLALMLATCVAGASLRAPSAHATLDPVPVGSILPWGGPTVPPGFLPADGAVVGRAAYADLFAAIGTTWGVGDGTTTFNLPDLRQRIPLGQSASGTGSTLGGTGGTIDHAPSVASHSHGTTSDNDHQHSAAHAHGAIAPIGLNSNRTTYIDPYDPALDVVGSHNFHSIRSAFYGNFAYPINSIAGNNERWHMTSSGPIEASGTGGAHTHPTGGATSTSSAANPPYLAVRYIVKASAGAAAPCGAMWHTAQAAPSGNLLPADGAAVSRAAQPALFACAGTTWGSGDGSTTFNVPDLRQRFAMGVAASGTGSTLGGTGGAIDHTHAAASHLHSIATGGAHSHGYGHSHYFGNALGISSNNTGVPSAADEIHDVAGTPYDFHSIVPMNFHGMVNQTHVETGWLESWVMRTSQNAPTVTTDGAHDHGGQTASAGATTSSSNPAFRSLQPFVARADGDLPGAGATMAFGGGAAPTGWLVADGSAVSRTTYDKLFAAIGTTYGAGDGSTTFTLPDLRGRHALGRATAGTGSALGSVGGTLDHAHTAAHAHSISAAGAHSHSVGSHSHQFMSPIGKSGASDLALLYPNDAAMSLIGTPTFSHINTTATMLCCLTPATFGAIETFYIDSGATSTSFTQSSNHAHGGATQSSSPTTSAANSPFATVRYLIRLNSAPLTPTQTSPAAATVVGDTTPTFTGTYLDADPTGTDTGQLEFEVCSDAACSSVVQAGSSPAGIAVSATASWTVPSVLPVGVYHWRVRATDDEGERSGWSATRSVRLDNPPDVPTLVSPAHLASTNDTTPDLVARHVDVDLDAGTLDVQVCSDPGCTTVIRSATTSSGSSGSNLAWTVTPALADPSQVWWRARANDTWGIQSNWSTTWRLDVETATTVSVDSSTVSMPGGTLANVDVTMTSIVTVGTTDPQGYTLHVTDTSDVASLTCPCGGSISDWTGTNAAPSVWAAGTAGGFGVTVLDAPAGRLGKWGTGTGTTATDFVNNAFAGLRSSTTTVLHSTTSASGPANVIVGWRVNVPPAQPAGAYSATVSISAIGNP